MGMRLFIAIDLEDGVKEKVMEIIKTLSEGDFDVKWVDSQNLHITLKFLGEVAENDVKVIEEKMKEIVKDLKPFKIGLHGVDSFGSEKYLKVVWVGMTEGENIVKELMMKMNKEFEHVKKDTFPPSAHLTIGRSKSGRNRELLLEKLKEYSDVKLCETNVNDIKLKQSILKREGPEYSDVKVFELG